MIAGWTVDHSIHNVQGTWPARVQEVQTAHRRSKCVGLRDASYEAVNYEMVIEEIRCEGMERGREEWRERAGRQRWKGWL